MKARASLFIFMFILLSYYSDAQVPDRSPLLKAGTYPLQTVNASAPAAPDWTRLLQASTYPVQAVNAVTADNNDDYYFAASMSGPVTYNLVNYTSTGLKDLLLVKISHSGVIQWTRQFDAQAGGSITANSMRTDASGNIYVSGDFTGTATFGTTALTSSATANSFIVKLDPSGDPEWAASFLSTLSGNNKMACDADGNIYLISKSNKLIKFSSGGALLWEQSYTSQTLQAISVYGSNLYVGGALQGSAPTSFGTIQLTPLGGKNTGFLARAGLDGTFNAALRIEGSETELGSSVADIATDDDGNLVITGGYTSELQLGLLSNNNPAMTGNCYTYMAKCDGNFVFEWMTSSSAFSNTNNNTMYTFKVFIDYNSYIKQYGIIGMNFEWDDFYIPGSGFTQYLVIFDQSGEVLFSNRLPSPTLNSIHCGRSGDPVTGGSYNYEESPDYGSFIFTKYDWALEEEWASASSGTNSGSIQVLYSKTDEGGNTYIQSRVLGKCNYFGASINTNVPLTIIAKHDINGNILWIKKIKDTNPELFGCAFTLDKNNNVITTGFFDQELRLDSFTLYGSGPYVAEFSSEGKFLWASAFDIGSGVSPSISVTSDNDGNVIAGGVKSPENYLIKFSPVGTKLWTKIMPMASDDLCLVSADAANNIYLASEIHLENHPDLSPVIIDGVTLTQTGSDGATALIRFNPDGVAQWGKLFGGVPGAAFPDGWPCDIDNDAAGNTYLWGWCANNAVFGSTVLSNPYPPNSYYSFYLTKINTSGDVVWAKAVYEKTYAFNYGNMQDLDESGNIYVGGHFRDVVVIEGIEYAPTGYYDDFTIKYTNDGEFRWIKTIPANGIIIESLDVSEEDVLSLAGRPGKDAALGTFAYDKKGGSTGIVATMGTLKYIYVSEDTLYIASPENSTVNFTLSSNTSWTLSSEVPWLVPDKTNGTGTSGIILTAQQNSTNTVREASIEIFRDGKKTNTIMVYQLGVPISTFPYLQEFSTWPPSSWNVNEGTIPWEHYNSSSAFVNFWEYNKPHYAVMKMPLFDFSSLSNPELNFDWSHKYYEGYDDQLIIAVTTDWKTWVTIWQKHLSELNSGDGALDEAPGTFTRASISLSDYAGEPFVSIAIIGVSGYGPNLYIDNVSISDVVASEPEAVTGPATAILQTSATLNGTVMPNGALTVITFEYGLTDSYGSTVNAVPSNAGGSIQVSAHASLTGLATNSVYHYRIVAANSKGIDYGSDVTFMPSGCTRLNYTTENISGTYNDLGTSGSAIITPDFDNANSSPGDIGFTFNFNCQDFTQFVLNTNGFIKLGNTPPSSSLFFSGPNLNDGILSSTDPSDVNILAPFTHDLIAGVLPAEYRVATTGSAPNRVCTIQFRNLCDKTANQQYENINFQVKLYETTNIIEYVYGPWTPSAGASVAKSAECGIKGNSPEANHIITVSKTSTSAWSTAVFQHNNYTGNALNFGNPPERPVPDQGRTFRFKPMKDFDASVNQVYTLIKLPVPIANPHVIQAEIRNTGLQDLSDITVTLTVTGANTFTSTKNVNYLYAGSYLIVSFDEFNPVNTGTNIVTVTTEADDDNTNNTLSIPQDVNLTTFSYADDGPAAGSLIYYNLCFTRFNISGTKAITGVKVGLSNDVNNIGNKVYAVVLNSSQELIGSSADFLITDEDNSNFILLPITDPPVITNSDFYVGLATTPPVGAAYYPVAFQFEIPTRPDAYYISFSGIDGPIYPYSQYRYIIEAIAEDPIITGVENTTTIDQPSGDISIYPNPATDYLVIDMNGFDGCRECNIKIINVSGATVYESNNPSARYEVDVSGFAKGYYLLQVYDKNNLIKTIKKVIIQ